MLFRLVFLTAVCLTAWCEPHVVRGAESPFSLSTFSAEVTPPVGHPLQGNIGVKPTTKIVDPLLAHGVVILGAGEPIVIVSVDWCGIGNDAHDLWRNKLAAAAGTKFERVLVCAIHQHDAPYVDLEGERLFAAQKLGKSTLDLEWHERTVDAVAEALAGSLKEARPLTHIGTGEAVVEKVASNRRVFGEDGKVAMFRGSAMKDPRAAEAPEGLIDPKLKTLSFWNGDKALASISVYATHPMSYYGQGEVSSDFPGLARRRRQADDLGVLHFYANGCGGNLAAGKYNDGSLAMRGELAERLYRGWKSAWEKTKRHRLDALTFRSIAYRLEPRETPGFQLDDLQSLLTGEQTPISERLRAAFALSWRKRCDAGRKLDLPMLDFGAAQLLLLPGEPFVEYQLFAQQQRPDSFVVTLGYGDYGPVYIPYDKAYAEGGYEPGSWSFVGVGVEKQLKDAIATALSQPPALSLAKDRATEFVIVTAAPPSAEEATAAEWLASTLEQVTGAKFPIRADGAKDLPQTIIRVAADPTMKPEEWRIRTRDGGLWLEGGRPRGTIYAVCEFLESHVGVARLDPFTEFVPKQPTLTIPVLNRRGQPAFPFRFVFTGWPYQNSLPRGVNGDRWRVWNKEHIHAGPVNGDYPRAVPDGVHTFGHFISAKEFAAEHPEYFSMDAAGKRMTDDMGNKQLWIQLCVTNEDVRRITLERAKQMLRDDEALAESVVVRSANHRLIAERSTTIPGRTAARMVVLSQNDNTANLCLCPNCKAISDREGSESGALLDFVNHVARGLKAEFPDVTVQTEAYNFTLAPPKTIRPEPNVMIRYCDNYGLSDMTRPLTDPRNAERLALLDVWAKSAQQLGIWDYWRTFDPHPPGLFAPSSNVRAMHRDIQLFRERNVKYVTIENEDFMGAGLNDTPQSNDLQSFMPLRCWLGMKLLDDPTRDVNALLDTFCKGYYGAAAKPMRELLEIIEERQSKITANSSNMRRHVWLESLCDATFFGNAYRCLDAAALAAKDDAASLIHVRRERIIVDASFLWIEASVRRQAVATLAKSVGDAEDDPRSRRAWLQDLAAKLPSRADVLQRHRGDWTAYVASVFDGAGQKTIAPLIEPGLQLLERLQTADTDSTRTALPTTEAEITHDGLLNESLWQQARELRLLPRDPSAANDDNSKFRFAWTAEALYVGIEQPLDKAAAIYEVSLMTPDRKGVQVALHAQPSGSVAAYFYAYPPTGMIAVPNRKSLSKFVASKTATHVTAEFRIPWTDLPTEAKPNDELLLNLATFPKPDSRVPSHVSSPWLIGTSPTYNPAYHATIRLGSKQRGEAATLWHDAPRRELRHGASHHNGARKQLP